MVELDYGQHDPSDIDEDSDDSSTYLGGSIDDDIHQRARQFRRLRQEYQDDSEHNRRGEHNAREKKELYLNFNKHFCVPLQSPYSSAIKTFYSVESAANSILESKSTHLLFSLPKYSYNDKGGGEKIARKYVVAPPDVMFRLIGDHMPRFNMVDEVILPFRRCRWFFDIEIDKKSDDRICGNDKKESMVVALTDYMKALKKRDVEIEGGGAEEDVRVNNSRLVRRLCRDYVEYSCMDWTEEECKAGIQVMTDTINDWLDTFFFSELKEEAGTKKALFRCSTGCRRKKFSMHLNAVNIYCDSPVLSMSVIAYQIARQFMDVNLEKVVHLRQQYGLGDVTEVSAEYKFRVRAMNLENLLIKVDTIRNQSVGLFKGAEDSPIDEVVYRSNHQLRTVGARKVTDPEEDTSFALVPYDLNGDKKALKQEKYALVKKKWSGNEANFVELFSGKQGRCTIRDWKEMLVTYDASCDDGASHGYTNYLCSQLTPRFDTYSRFNEWDRNCHIYGHMVSCYSKTPFVGKAVNMTEIIKRNRHRDYRRTRTSLRMKERHRREEERRNNPSDDVPQYQYRDPNLVREFGTSFSGRKSGYAEGGNVRPEDKFLTESGAWKKFEDMGAGESFVHGCNTDDQNGYYCRAYKWDSGTGYTCTDCKSRFSFYNSEAYEEYYPFDESLGEVTEKADPYSHFEDMKWEKYLKSMVCEPSLTDRKKFIIMDGTQGSGKTYQLDRLISLVNAQNYSNKHLGNDLYPPYRCCCLMYRKALSRDVSSRTVMFNYSDYKGDLDQTVDSSNMQIQDNVCIVVNSLTRITDEEYDVVIVDEFGLLRRHLLASVSENCLSKVWPKLVRMIQKAKMVVLSQANCTLGDVEFYTSLDQVDPLDRNYVVPIQLKKPVEIQPIQYTKNLQVATKNLFECYEKSLQPSEDNGDNIYCNKPIIVFCSSVNYAQFLVSQLQRICKEKGGKEKTVKGIWNDVSGTKFVEMFSRFPNHPDIWQKFGGKCEVLVVTSVLGAGFDLTSMSGFKAFHAFLFNRILTTEEEIQFIRRLRKEKAINEMCYVYIEPGSGSKMEYELVLEAMQKMRRETLRHCEGCDYVHTLNLVTTSARISAERSESFLKHDEKFISWGGSLTSDFDPMCEDNVEDVEREIKEAYSEFRRLKKQRITQMIHNLDYESTGEEKETGVMEEAEQVVTAPSSEDSFLSSFYIEQEGRNLDKFINRNFETGELGKALVMAEAQSLEGKNDRAVLIQKTTRIKATTNVIKKMTFMLIYLYQKIFRDDEDNPAQAHLKKINANFSVTSSMKRAGYTLAESFLYRLLMRPLKNEGKSEYIRNYSECGRFPFYTDMVIVFNEALRSSIKSLLHSSGHHCRMNGNHKKDLRKRLNDAATALYMGVSPKGDNVLSDVYSDNAHAQAFVKKLFEQLGMKLKFVGFDNDRHRMYQVATPIWNVVYMFSHKSRKVIIPVLQELLFHPMAQFHQKDRQWLRSAIDRFNDVVTNTPGLQHFKFLAESTVTRNLSIFKDLSNYRHVNTTVDIMIDAGLKCLRSNVRQAPAYITVTDSESASESESDTNSGTNAEREDDIPTTIDEYEGDLNITATNFVELVQQLDSQDTAKEHLRYILLASQRTQIPEDTGLGSDAPILSNRYIEYEATE